MQIKKSPTKCITMLLILVLFFAPKAFAVSSSPSKGGQSVNGTGYQEDTRGKRRGRYRGAIQAIRPSEILPPTPPAMIGELGTHPDHGEQVTP